MEIDVITQYIISLAPAITAICSVIATIIISLKKIKSIANDSTVEMGELKALTSSLLKENAELKKEIRRSIHKVSTIEEIQERKK